MARLRDDLAVLGLEAGADRNAIDDAFKRLMKQYHPDVAGGDNARAAEIIRAYRALRPGAISVGEIEFLHRPGDRPVRWVWLLFALIAIGAATVGAALIDPTPTSGPARLGADVATGLGLKVPKQADFVTEPLSESTIDSAVDEARSMVGRQDEVELAAKSRDCHLDFRRSQDLAAFDRCVAFDVAVMLLQDRDPLRDQGPFRQVAVNRRHWSNAALLTSDSLAIDGRLDRIRLRVELRLAPVVPEAEPVPDPTETQPVVELPDVGEGEL